MISIEAIETLPVELQSEVVRAILVIADSSVLNLQKDLNLVRLSQGSTKESDAELANRILEYRRQNHVLDSFAALAESLAEKED